MNKISRFFLLSAFMVLQSAAFSQSLFETPDMKGKYVAGGNMDLGATGYTFNFSVAPQIGYRLTSNLEVGVRLAYDFIHYNPNYYNYSLNYHYFGAAAYANCQFLGGLFVHVEDEQLYQMAFSQHAYVNDDSRWYNSFFVGGGYRQYFSENSYTQLMLLWNMNETYDPITGTYNSPYINPVFRVGYFFGF